MKKLIPFILLILTTLNSFSQAREAADSNYLKVYEIIILKEGEVKHVIKQGAEISAKINGEIVYGRWYFSSYPDKVVVITKKGEKAGVIELNKQNPLRIVTPQPKGGMSVGIGVGPIGVSTGGGSGMQSFNMGKYKAEITERQETKEEKIKREYYEKKEQERMAKEAAKKAKKEAKKNKKK